MTQRTVPANSLSEQERMAYACDHVLYEIDMFSRSAGAVTKAREQWPMNVAIEVFSIHLRNLLDFFYPGGRVKPGDVTARLFSARGPRGARRSAVDS